MKTCLSEVSERPASAPERAVLRDLRKLTGLEVLEGVPLAPMTTFRIGGPARVFLRPSDVGALERTVAYMGRRAISYRILGQGSNLLVDDSGVGVVLSLDRLTRLKPLWQRAMDGASHGPNRPGLEDRDRPVSVEGGCRLMALLAWSIRQGCQGLEGLAGIPASLGGAVAMNAGTAERALSDVFRRALLVTPEGSAWWGIGGLGHGYRRAGLPSGAVVAAVELTLEDGLPSEIRRRISRVLARRRATQPCGVASAGCVFRNPSGLSAGRLIEACGLKGRSVGDAYVSDRHANFIVNRGNARAQDVLMLMEEIRNRVWQQMGVALAPEVCIWEGVDWGGVRYGGP